MLKNGIGVGDLVMYRDKGLGEKVFQVLPCVCSSCQGGDTLLVDLPSVLDKDVKRHVGHEMIERAT